MNTKNRRAFLKKSGLALSASALLPIQQLLGAAADQKMPVGFQTYPIREMLGSDFAGTLKLMAGMGYSFTEMCYPKTYEKIGFAALAAMSTMQIKETIAASGLGCTSCHFGFGDFTDQQRLADSIRFCQEMSISRMICSTFWLPKTATLQDYLSAADQLNKAAEQIHQAGLQAGFHNHSFEFVVLDGELIYDALLKQFDPALVRMQFQTEVINLGFKGADYFRRYPGRFNSAHLSDWTREKKAVPIGSGIIDWNEFFAAASTGGVDQFYVEMNFDTLKDSADFVAHRRWER